VYRSYLLKFNAPPHNAFSLVNHSRKHPRLREVSYAEAKQIIRKHAQSKGQRNSAQSAYGKFKVQKIGKLRSRNKRSHDIAHQDHVNGNRSRMRNGPQRDTRRSRDDADDSSKSSDRSGGSVLSEQSLKRSHSSKSSGSARSGKAEAVSPRNRQDKMQMIPNFSPPPIEKQSSRKRAPKKESEPPHPRQPVSPRSVGVDHDPPRKRRTKKSFSPRDEAHIGGHKSFAFSPSSGRNKIAVRRRKNPNHDQHSAPLRLKKSFSDDVDHYSSSPRVQTPPSYPHAHNHPHHRTRERHRKKSQSDPKKAIDEYQRKQHRKRPNKFRNDNDVYTQGQGHEVVYQSKYRHSVSRDMEKLVLIKDRKGRKRRAKKRNSVSSKPVSANFGSINVGDFVVLKGRREGQILYIGAVHFAEGIWFGVELIDGSLGVHDGAINGRRYFKTPPQRGVFVQGHKIRSKLADRQYAHSRQRRHSIQSDNSSNKNTSSPFAKARSVNSPKLNRPKTKRSRSPALNIRGSKSPSKSPRERSERSPRHKVRGSRSKPSRRHNDRAHEHDAHLLMSAFNDDGIIYDVEHHNSSYSSPSLQMSTAQLALASEITVNDITAPRSIENESASSGKSHSPPSPLPPRHRAGHLMARSVDHQDFVDMDNLKAILRSEIEMEFESKFEELRQMLRDKEKKDQRRRRRKRRKRKKKRRRSRVRDSNATARRSKSLNMNGRKVVGDPEDEDGDEEEDEEEDVDVEDEVSPMPVEQRSDFELSVNLDDLQLDDVASNDSNDSDEYAKSSDLQRGSNGSNEDTGDEEEEEEMTFQV